MVPTIPPADMLLFAAVVREGGFTRAATKLGLSKQTVSERIGKLEARLGARLLERTTRRLRPTDAGAVYYERCAAIAAQIDEANAEVQRRQAEPVGLLRVSAPVLFGRRFLAPVIAAYLARHPKVRVEVLLADRRVNLVEEGVDLAIRIGELEDSSLTAHKIGEGHVYFVASPRYLRGRRAPRPRGLAAERCIALRPHETWAAGGASVKIDPVLIAGDHEIACEAAIAGVGIARLPTLVAWAPIRDGRLRVLFGRAPALARPVYAVYPSRQGLAAKVRVFVDALVAMEQPELSITPRPAPRSRAARRASSSS